MIIKYRDKIIGNLEDGVFTKNVKRSKHFMKIFNGWGIQSSVFNGIESRCKEIVINDIESNLIYKTNTKIYREHGILKDMGHGMQIFLDEKYFEKLGGKQNKLI